MQLERLGTEAHRGLHEFILCGKPVITNDYPGLHSVVAENGLGACLATVDAQAIAAAARESALRLSRRPPGDSPYVWEAQEDAYLRLFG